jgi:hypothetical protein
MQRGIFEFEVGGVARGFKFGTYALGITEREEGRPVSEILAHLEFNSTPLPILTLLNIFYGSAVAYVESKKQKQDFVKSDVSDWLDELGLEKVYEMLMSGLNQYVPKNSKSPAQIGEIEKNTL